MNRRLVCLKAGEVGWLEVPRRSPAEGEVLVRPTYGVEKHGTMAAFVKGYGNARGRWDSEARIHRQGGMLWSYPVPLGNMQFGETETGERVAWFGPFESSSVVKESSLRQLGTVEWIDAAMLDPGTFALGALRDGNARIGDSVAIFGLGAIGLAAVQLAHAAGASQIFALDPIESRRRIAEKYGAVTIDPTTDDAGLTIREATGMRGVDVVIEYSGAWRAFQASFRAVAYGGTIVCGAFPPPFPAGLDLGGEAHMNRPRVIFSRACSDPNPDHPRWDEQRIIESVWGLISSGSLKGDGIIDAPIPFEDLPEVYPQIAEHPESHLKLSVRYPL